MTSAIRRTIIKKAVGSPLTTVLVVLLTVFAGYLFWPISSSYQHSDRIVSTRITDRNGILLREIRPKGSGIPINLNAVNQHLIDAVVAIEDRHFYAHFGINPISIYRAFKENAAAGEVVRGGSTLTMQVARTLRGNQPRTVVQKIAEAFLALRLEAKLSKDEILSLWLNKVYFGNLSYGVEAAAQLYFKKGTSDLTLGEAAFLAGLPQRPNAYNPYKNLSEAYNRQKRVLTAMFEASYISRSQLEQVLSVPLHIEPFDAAFKAPHFIEFIRRQQHTASNNLALQDALEIKTTLDLSLQQTIESLANAHLERLGNDRASNAAAIVIDNQSGDVLAYLGSVDFWNESIQGQNDGVMMLRQPGSALKPFTYAIALSSKKYTPASILPDIEIHIPEAGGAFSPLNYDKKFHGPVSLRTSLASSYNVPAVRLLREYGPASLLDHLHKTGFQSLNRQPEHYGVGLTLGNGEVQLAELAQGYASFARHGETISINAIKSIIDGAGKTHTNKAETAGQDVFSPEVSYLITHILQDPEARSPAFGRYGPLELPFPVAVKTGTSKDYRDNWAVGFTPIHTVAVWVGNFDGKPMRRVSGVSGAGPLFHAIMQHLGSGGNFVQPAEIETAMICPLSGLKPGPDCPGIRKEIFFSGTMPVDTCETHQVFDIDKRNGSLADQQTPTEFIEPTLFTVFDDQYASWATDNGILSPPKALRTSAIQTSAMQTSQVVQEALEIMYPKSGMIFQMDPVLHPSFQKIKLKGINRGQLLQPTWWINDQSIQGTLEGTFWTLTEGAHKIELKAQDEQGNLIESSPVVIQVMAYTSSEENSSANAVLHKPASQTAISLSK